MNSGILYALLTAILWGTVPVMEKFALSVDVKTYNLVILRSVVVGIFAIIISPFTGFLEEMKKLPLKNGFLIAASGIIAGFIAMFVYYNALKKTEASLAVPIASTYPLFAIIFSFIILKEQITLSNLIGAVLIVAGILIISVN